MNQEHEIGGGLPTSYPKVIFYVLAPTRKKHQIFRSIITSVAIEMMHIFFLLKETSHLLFHHKSVLQNVVIVRLARMVRRIYLNIPVRHLMHATFPHRMFFPSYFRHFPALIPGLLDSSHTFVRWNVLLKKTLSTTELGFFPPRNRPLALRKLFYTNQTLFG